MSVQSFHNEDLGWRPPTSDTELKTGKPPPLNDKNEALSPKKTSGKRTWPRILAIFLLVVVVFFIFNILRSFFGFGSPQFFGLGYLLFFAAVFIGFIFLFKRLWKGPATAENSFLKNEDFAQKGIVKGFTQGSETLVPKFWKQKYKFNNKIVWHFRIECFDQDGNRTNTIPVKMSGDGFQGAVNEGDVVQVSNGKPGELLQTDRVKNWTSGIEVKAINHPIGTAYWIKYFIFCIISVLIIGWVLVVFLTVITK